MTSTSCKALAEEVLARSIAGDVPRTLPRALADEACAGALFTTLVEGLADRFEPALAAAYAHLFSQAVAYARPGIDAAALVAHYGRVRRVRRAAGDPRRVFVLSRVTLGADVAVTSVLLDAAKQRFPRAEIVFAGPRKNYELFAGDARLRHAPVEYRRGSLRERLRAWDDLKALLDEDALVIDPDSRLTQLGLLPVCAAERHHLFESRAYRPESGRPLTELAAEWAEETLGAAAARPYVALGRLPERRPYIAVSLGVGGNASKRLPDPFEEELLRLLASTGMPLCIDRGTGGEEAARVEHAAQRAGVAAVVWDGSFAGFAAMIAGSRLYAGYDSAGQHVAEACGVPLISIFTGFAAPRMFERWRPASPGARVIRLDSPDTAAALADVRAALAAAV